MNVPAKKSSEHARFAVRVTQPTSAEERDAVAREAAGLFGIEVARVERMMARAPGIITKPGRRAYAERVANILRSAGAQADVVEVLPGNIPVDVAGEATLDVSSVANYGAITAKVASNKVASDKVASDKVAKLPEAIANGSSTPPDVPSLPSPSLASASLQQPALQGGHNSALDASLYQTQEIAPLRKRRLPLAYKLFASGLLPLLLLAVSALLLSYQTVERLVLERFDLTAELWLVQLDNNLPEADATQLQRLLNAANSSQRPAQLLLYDPSSEQLMARASSPSADISDLDSASLARAAHSALVASLQSDSTAQHRLSQQGRDYLLHMRPLAGAATPAASTATSMLVGIVVHSQRQLRQQTWQALQPLLGLIVLCVLLALLLLSVVALPLSRRIRRLVSVADRISLGNLDEPVTVAGRDDLRDLAEALEKMRQSLQAAVERLRRREREARQRMRRGR